MKIFRSLKILFCILSASFSAQTEMPIMGFHSFTPETSTLENFLKFKEAGFNINHTVFVNNEQVQSALDLAHKAGIKIIFYSDNLKTETETTVLRFKNHPALYGYFLSDEPSPKDFAGIQVLKKKIEALDPNHFIYVNLHPNYAPQSYLENLEYNAYVDLFLKTINVKVLSFDNYPIVNNKVNHDWYHNLEIIRKNALKYNKPFWAFANATIFYNYKQPTIAGLKLQQFSNLLYGAKGLQYFTYVTMDDEYWKMHKFSYAIIHNNGKPTPTYNLVKTLNKQIKTLSWVFLKSKVDSVYHVGDTIPVGTRRMNFLPKKFKKFKTFERQALVSFMTSGSRKFVAVQNKDIFRPMSLNYELENGVSIVDNKTGKINTAPTRATNFSIPPGDIIIFTYQ